MKKRNKQSGAATSSILLMSVQIVTTILGLIITKLLSVNFSLKVFGYADLFALSLVSPW